MKTSFLKLVTFVFYLTIQLFTLNCLYDPNQPLDEFIENEFINDEEVEEIDVQDDEEAVTSEENGEENSNNEGNKEANIEEKTSNDNSQPVEINSQIIDDGNKIIETNSKDNTNVQIVGTKEDIITRSDKINGFSGEEKRIDAIPSQAYDNEKENEEDDTSKEELAPRNILLDGVDSDENMGERNLVGGGRGVSRANGGNPKNPNGTQTEMRGTQKKSPKITSSSTVKSRVESLLGSVSSSSSSSDSTGGTDIAGILSDAFDSISSPCIGSECAYERVQMSSAGFLSIGTNEYEYKFEDYRNTNVTITYRNDLASDVITRFRLVVDSNLTLYPTYEILQSLSDTQAGSLNYTVNLWNDLFQPLTSVSPASYVGSLTSSTTHRLVFSTCYNVSSSSWTCSGTFIDEIIININL